MLKWRLKACARCSGDLFIDRDMDGWFEQCLQCSYRRELKDIKDFKKTAVAVGDKSINWSEED
jgi:DNA-directed RNA polymerase subunit RPC12/RpoP